MKKVMLILASAVGLCACGFPQTKMEPVGETQMQTQTQPQTGAQPAPAQAGDEAKQKKTNSSS